MFFRQATLLATNTPVFVVGRFQDAVLIRTGSGESYPVTYRDISLPVVRCKKCGAPFIDKNYKAAQLTCWCGLGSFDIDATLKVLKTQEF